MHAARDWSLTKGVYGLCDVAAVYALRSFSDSGGCTEVVYPWIRDAGEVGQGL